MKSRRVYYIISLEIKTRRKLDEEFWKRIKEIINRDKKNLKKGISIFIVLVVLLSTLAIKIVYSIANSNVNYSVEEAQEIALKAIDGEVLRVNKNLELDNFSFEYEFKIKDSNNILKEVTVDATFGVITDLDNYYD